MAKESIEQSLTALDDSLSDNAIEQYVSRLRRRLAPLGLMLRSAQGIGYLLEKPAKDGVSALAIAERVSVDINGGLEVDIPYSSLEMLASTAQDRVFYRVDAPTGIYLTGYENLFVVALVLKATSGFADGIYSETRMRSATLTRCLSTGSQYIAFIVTVTESTRGREALARVIPVRSALRLMVLILSVVSIVWIAVTWALRPLDRLVEEIARRSPDDLHPVKKQTVQEVDMLVGTANSFMQRLDTALAALKHFTGNASHQLRCTQLTLIDRSQRATHSCHANEGHGLGLAISAEIAAPFGARIDLQPGPGGTGLSASVILQRAG